MNQIMPYINDALDFAHEGFQSVNAVLGLLIAIGAVFLLGSYQRILVVTAGATVVHLIAERLVPVLASKAAFHLPDVLAMPFWRHVGLLLVGYFIVISILYLIKSLFFRGGH
jgi:hypothetical protein